MNFLEAMFKVLEGVADFCDDTGFPSPTEGDSLHKDEDPLEASGEEVGSDDTE